MDADFIASRDVIVTVDLLDQTIDGVLFNIPKGDKMILVGGLDGIDLTLKHNAEIDHYFERDQAMRPWVY